MLYVEPSAKVVSKWQTVNYRFPIDVVWIDAGRCVEGVTENIAPDTGAIAWPMPVAYEMEVNGGAARRLGLVEGACLAFDIPAPPPGSEP